MKIYIWESFEGAPYDDSPADATLFTTEAEAVQDIRGTLNMRRDDYAEENANPAYAEENANPAPLIPDNLGGEDLVQWAKDQPEYAEEARLWKFSIWDTDDETSILVAGW